MARYKRIYSETGIYHAMSRGNNKNDIFIDAEDKEKYLNILVEKNGGFQFYFICLLYYG